MRGTPLYSGTSSGLFLGGLLDAGSYQVGGFLGTLGGVGKDLGGILPGDRP